MGEGREGKGREGKGREGKGREGKGREGKGSEAKRSCNMPGQRREKASHARMVSSHLINSHDTKVTITSYSVTHAKVY